MFRRRATSTRRHHRLSIERLEERTVMASWLGQIGGPGSESGQYRDALLDDAGNSYLTGLFSQTASFDSDTALTSNGGYDSFVAKYTPDGSLEWARGFGGSQLDSINGSDIDDAGQFVYVTGTFTGTADFGGFVLTSEGSGADGFILKVNTGTGDILWAKRIGGAAAEYVTDVAAGAGVIYVTGHFSTTVDFDPGPGTVLRTPTAPKGKNTNPDVFVLTLDADGSFQSVWQIGGKDIEVANDILFDGSSLYLQGSFLGTTDFDPGPGTAARTSTPIQRAPTTDFFLARYSPTGALTWVQTIGNSGPQTQDTVQLAADGDSLYLTGYFKGALDFDPGPSSATLTSVGGSFEAVVAKYQKSDGSYVWAQQYGAAGEDIVQYTVVDEATGKLYVGGWFTGAVDFNPGGAGGELTTDGSLDGFLLKLDAAFGDFEHVWQVSGPDQQSVRPLGVLHTVVDGVPQSTIIATGGFRATATFPTGGSLTSAGDGDIYLMALEEGALSSPILSSLPGSSSSSAQDVDLALLALSDEWTSSTGRKTKKQ